MSLQLDKIGRRVNYNVTVNRPNPRFVSVFIPMFVRVKRLSILFLVLVLFKLITVLSSRYTHFKVENLFFHLWLLEYLSGRYRWIWSVVSVIILRVPSSWFSSIYRSLLWFILELIILYCLLYNLLVYHGDLTSGLLFLFFFFLIVRFRINWKDYKLTIHKRFFIIYGLGSVNISRLGWTILFLTDFSRCN